MSTAVEQVVDQIVAVVPGLDDYLDDLRAAVGRRLAAGVG